MAGVEKVGGKIFYCNNKTRQSNHKREKIDEIMTGYLLIL